ncbi:AAA family ATPase [Pseudomonas aegrilactucae]|uniref:ATP-binding protein n=1 Tax=Pseudomonas aegrilactucae TaxID=2854028 RepID=A0A9Q2XFF2_9PSED|nr:AAA family ATPase [Pseudomonas aegrilactucae]MBV6286088.1 ATP-binding protein [Pseudomonas aegrilactucae]
MLDERDLEASALIEAVNGLRTLFKRLADIDFQRLVLYTAAAHCVDLTQANHRIEAWLNSDAYTDTPNIIEIISFLMAHCAMPKTGVTQSSLKGTGFGQLQALLAHAFKPCKEADRLYLFDALFFHALARLYKGNARHSASVAALANGLHRTGELVDIHAYSGQAFVLDQSMPQGELPCLLDAFTLPHQDLVTLRLYLYDVELKHVEDFKDLWDGGLALIDTQLPGMFTPGKAVETLQEVLRRSPVNQRVLVVLGHTPTIPSALRERVIDGEWLEALIDFTSFDQHGKPIRLTACLLNRDHASSGQVLCIDACLLQTLAPDTPAAQAMWLAAAIIDLWSRAHHITRECHAKVTSGAFRHLFAQRFGKAYKNVEGLCKAVPIADALSEPLTAARHMDTIATLSGLSLLDTRPLHDLLLNASDTPRCIYVIGDNGAGKSLMLNALIEQLDECKINSVGIAFGQADRFPVGKPRTRTRFRYEGNRTGDQKVSPRQSAARLNKQLLKIYCDEHRLPLFMHALQGLDFKRRQYLLPFGVPDELLMHMGDSAGQVALTDDALHNTTLLAAKDSHWEFSLLREDASADTRHIVRFSQLSSGEQQIIALFARIAATAERGQVVLIDEPEISLHVRWQQALPSLLAWTGEKVGCSFVVATHSPTLVANAQGDHSHCFLAKGGALEPIPAEQRRSVETLLMEGFQTYTPHNREVHERCAALVSQAIRASNQGNDQSVSMLSTLGELEQIMLHSLQHDNGRFKQDLNLVKQARRAIREVFALANEPGHA